MAARDVTFGEASGKKYVYMQSAPASLKPVDNVLSVPGGFVAAILNSSANISSLTTTSRTRYSQLRRSVYCFARDGSRVLPLAARSDAGGADRYPGWAGGEGRTVDRKIAFGKRRINLSCFIDQRAGESVSPFGHVSSENHGISDHSCTGPVDAPSKITKSADSPSADPLVTGSNIWITRQQ